MQALTNTYRRRITLAHSTEVRAGKGLHRGLTGRDKPKKRERVTADLVRERAIELQRDPWLGAVPNIEVLLPPNACGFVHAKPHSISLCPKCCWQGAFAEDGSMDASKHELIFILVGVSLVAYCYLKLIEGTEDLWKIASFVVDKHFRGRPPAAGSLAVTKAMLVQEGKKTFYLRAEVAWNNDKSFESLLRAVHWGKWSKAIVAPDWTDGEEDRYEQLHVHLFKDANAHKEAKWRRDLDLDPLDANAPREWRQWLDFDADEEKDEDPEMDLALYLKRLQRHLNA
jgi:hypothetical protein